MARDTNPNRRARRLAVWALQAVLASSPAVSGALAAPLAPLLSAPGATVSLDPGTVYTIGEYVLTADKTILCNGARITSTTGPIRASAPGVRLVVDTCRIDGTGWALLGALDGTDLVVRNTELTGDGANSAIYGRGSTVDVTGGFIADGRWGLNLENADAAMHGLVVRNTPYAVQNVAGAVTLDQGCDLTNVQAGNSGTGVGLIASPDHPRGASAVIRDSTFTGFGNAVDVQPTAARGLPAGTVDIAGSTFNTPFVSALSTVDAVNVRFASSRVLDAQADGVFFVNSSGVIVEDSEILDSLNSGVSFYGCPSGGMIRNSLVRGSAHQGISIVADPANDRPSHGIRVLDTTVDGSVVANVLVDDRSDALIQGGLFSGAPDMSVRLHGSPAVRFIGGLVFDSHRGLEIKDGADVDIGLSAFTGHALSATLAYANAKTTVSHSAFHANGTDPGAADYSVFANAGADVALDHCALGPAGANALYNNAGDALTATGNYWGDPSGPVVQSGGGSGSVLAWNASNGSAVSYEPFMSTPPLDFRIDRTISLAAGATATWDPDIGLGLSLTGAPGVTTVQGGVVGALRLRDTSALTLPAPPVGTFADGVFVVWIAFDVLSRTGAGTLRITTTGDAPLARLDADGQWTPVGTTWDTTAGQIVYTPADPRALQGIFALGNGQGCTTARTCLQSIVVAALCTEPLPKALERAVARKLRAAMKKLDKAAAATDPGKAARFVQRASKALEAVRALAARFARSPKRSISEACRDTIGNALGPALQRIAAGAL